MARKRKNNKAIFARNSIIAFVSAITILIIGFGTYVSTDLGRPGEIAEDRDYVEVDDPAPRRAGDPIDVAKHFSYTCIHCKNFDPVFDDWAEDQSDDVTTRKVPVAWSPIQTVMAQTYLALEESDAVRQNHNRIFRALHDGNRQFLTPEMVADYVDGRGVEREVFIRTFNSPGVRNAMRDASAEQRKFGIASTPSLVVAGRYVVGMRGGQNRALEVVDHLVAKIREEDAQN